ncbi:MAG: hypothetical protein IJY12_00905 [Clostridia bacterium]|nr:hypothetical protein [Clostridia bacterium]
MKREDAEMALNEISDAHVNEAATTPKRIKKKFWWGILAAAMSFVLVVGLLLRPMTIHAQAICVAEYPEYQWVYRSQVTEDAKALTDFFKESISTVLTGADGGNYTYSPINLYMALSIVSEMASGGSRDQILSLLNVGSIEELRTQTGEIWNACYCDSKTQTLLANSVWLDEGLGYNREVMELLAENYYTSVYQAELSDTQTAKDIRAWLNNNTGGLLKEKIENVASGFDESTLFAIYSTVFFKAKWSTDTEFDASQNTKDVFHSPEGDVTCTYMNHKLLQTNYYWSEDCSAVSLGLKNGNCMWFILPDDGFTVDDVLASGSYMDLIAEKYTEGSNSKFMKVNLSIPKFDIQWSSDLKGDLTSLGVTDVFDETLADFSDAIDSSAYLTAVNQATRVCIDEEGVTAASYIEIPGATSPAPPEEIIDFIVDRPFIFVIENPYGLPLFAGVVNNPG